MRVGDKVLFLRDIPPMMYDYNKPEEGTIVKTGKTLLHVKLFTTGVIHKFNKDTFGMPYIHTINCF